MDAGKVADVLERVVSLFDGGPDDGPEVMGQVEALVAELRAEAAKVIDSPKATLCAAPGCLASPRAPGFMWCGPHASWELTGRSA